MTGFGCAGADIDRPGHARTRWLVETRSVNLRAFVLMLRLAEAEPALEAELSRQVRAAVERGAVTLSIREERPAATGLDADRIHAAALALENVRRQAGISTPVDLR